jgi:arsenate reductase (thioredoxin)
MIDRAEPSEIENWNPMSVTLTTTEQLQIRQAAERLQRQFAGSLTTETVERFMNDSLDTLMERATTSAWIPLLAERFARDRLRALVRLESDQTTLNPSILFLCVHNAGRSQMAAGWARKLAGDRVDVFSGGSEPADQVNVAAVEAMAEVGVNISGEIPQPWADEIVRAADVIVSMGCGDACPIYPGRRYLDWELDDPSGKTLEEVRPIRDELEARVRGLLAELLPDHPLS